MRTSVLAAIVVCAGLLSAGALVHSYQLFDAEPRKFSKEEWHKHRVHVESSNDPGCVLGGFTQDILNKESLKAKTEQYVLDQLGPPSRREDSNLVYFVGQCHGWGWEHSELVVRVSEAGVVLGAQTRVSR